MNGAPLVSIVTPCLNPGEWLARCLDCVAAQSYPNVEHIVVDGGSTDGSVDLLRSHGVEFVSEPDGGQTEAINKGFARARGEWLTWLGADDLLLPNAVERAVAAVQAVGGAGWVYGESDLREAGERLLYLRPPARVDAVRLAEGNCIPQPGALVARWALDRIGPLDESLHLAMDFDLWLRLVDEGVPSAYIPQLLSIYEVHPGSKTGSVSEAEFVFETAVSLLKSGRRRAGSRMLGRAAVTAARSEGDRVPTPRLKAEIATVVERLPGRGYEADLRVIRATAYGQAALLGLYARPRSFRHLARLRPWLDRDARRAFLEAARRAVRRRTHGDGAEPASTA